jgi:hypothetical protein
VLLVCVLVCVYCRWRSRDSLHLRTLRDKGGLGWRDLLAALHPRHLIKAMWEAEIATLLISDNIGTLEGMM